MELAGDLLLEREFHLGLQFTGVEHFKEISLSLNLNTFFSTSSIKPPSFYICLQQSGKQNGMGH